MSSITESLSELMTTDGALAVALVDSGSGMMLGAQGGGIDIESAAAGNTELVRATLRTMKLTGLNEAIDDILVTLGRQYHIIRPLTQNPEVFFYLVLDRAKANLALARIKTKAADAGVQL